MEIHSHKMFEALVRLGTGLCGGRGGKSKQASTEVRIELGLEC